MQRQKTNKARHKPPLVHSTRQWIFGGLENSALLDDTWVWDGSFCGEDQLSAVTTDCVDTLRWSLVYSA